MGKTNAAVELRVSSHASFNPRHADEAQARIATVKLVAKIFEAGCGEPFGFVDDDKLDQIQRRGGASPRLRVEALHDAGVHAADERRWLDDSVWVPLDFRFDA